MSILLVLLLCLLATTKVSLQSSFGRRNIRNTSDVMLFNGLVFVFSALLFFPRIIGCSPQVWLYALIFGLFTSFFQITYTQALAMGSVSLTVMFVNLSMVIPVIFSFIVYQEPISVFGFLGILLTLTAFLIGTDFKHHSSHMKAWFILTFATVLSNSVLSITQKIFSRSVFAKESQAFVSCSYIIAAILTLSAYMFMHLKKQPKTFKLSRWVFLYVACIGIVLATYQAVNTYAAQVVNAAFLYPATSGGCIICSALTGLLLFHDELSKKQKLSIGISALAIVLMNF